MIVKPNRIQISRGLEQIINTTKIVNWELYNETMEQEEY